MVADYFRYLSCPVLPHHLATLSACLLFLCLLIPLFTFNLRIPVRFATNVLVYIFFKLGVRRIFHTRCILSPFNCFCLDHFDPSIITHFFLQL